MRKWCIRYCKLCKYICSVVVLRLKINVFYDSFFSIISARLLELAPFKKGDSDQNYIALFSEIFPHCSIVRVP